MRRPSGPATGLALLMLILPFLVGGCATMEEAGRNQKLRFQLDSYDHVVRWGDLEEMYGYVKPGGEPLKVPRGLENIRVTEYEQLGPLVPEGEHRVRRRVKIDYLYRDRQVIRTLVDEQLWEYDETLEHWFRVNPPPEF